MAFPNICCRIGLVLARFGVLGEFFRGLGRELIHWLRIRRDDATLLLHAIQMMNRTGAMP